MASYVKFNKFVLNLGNKVFNFGSDSLKLALTNTAPTVATDNQLSDIVSPVTTNLSTLAVTTTSFTQTSGTAKLICADLVITASGAVSPFRYVVLYDDTATNDELVGYWDYGSSVTMANTETFTVDFDGTNGVFTIA